MGALVTEHEDSMGNWSLPMKLAHKWSGTAGVTLPPSGLFAKNKDF